MTTLRPQTPSGYTLFCDDIRKEEGGKLTLVGLYGPELIVFAPLPAILPKFGMLITYVERPQESDAPLELQVSFPGDPEGEPSHRISVSDDVVKSFRNVSVPAEVSSLDEAILVMKLDGLISPFVIQQEGFVRVSIVRGDLQIRVGSLRIRSQAA